MKLNSKVKIEKSIIQNHHKPYIVAEISANHLGKVKNIIKLIDIAKNAGASAAKIQTYDADSMTLDLSKKDFLIKSGIWKGNNLFKLYDKAKTPLSWHSKIFSYSRKKKINCFSTPVDERTVDFLKKFNLPCYKIASCEASNFELIEYIAKLNKPVIISTGVIDFDEITKAVNIFLKVRNKNLILLHCNSDYPSKHINANLNTIKDLQETFKIPIGFSDHYVTNEASYAAVALGAAMIEKHITLNKKNSGLDNIFSLEPKTLKEFCNTINNIFLSMGKVDYEKNFKKNSSYKFRRSIYFSKNIKKNEKINSQNIRIIRPGYGLRPLFYKKILGKKVKKNIKEGTAVKLKYIKI